MTAPEERKTVVIRWREISDHERTVSVPADWDTEDEESLVNSLADLDDDGFISLEREIESVEVVPWDDSREEFDPR